MWLEYKFNSYNGLGFQESLAHGLLNSDNIAAITISNHEELCHASVVTLYILNGQRLEINCENKDIGQNVKDAFREALQGYAGTVFDIGWVKAINHPASIPSHDSTTSE